MSLQEILCQAQDKTDYYWYESATPHTTGGLWQHCIEVRSTPSPAVESIFAIYGKAPPRRCEAMDSTLFML